jgi:hypothetical protein
MKPLGWLSTTPYIDNVAPLAWFFRESNYILYLFLDDFEGLRDQKNNELRINTSSYFLEAAQVTSYWL